MRTRARSTSRAMCQWQPWAALLLLMVTLAQLLGAATQLSATIDEGFHITSGYEYLRTGQMRLFDEHVPLVKALFAWPLFFVPDLPPPEEAAGWAEGDLIGVAQHTLLAYQPIDRVIVPPRVVVALLTLLVGATVYRWAANLFGSTAGLFSLALFAFDPNVLAHGSLATTDMGAVAFTLWAVWAFARYLETPVRRPVAQAGANLAAFRGSWTGRWWMAALLLGLALGAKLTATLLLPVLGLLALVDAWVKTPGRRVKASLKRAASFGGMVTVAALVVWALYFFEVRTLPRVAGDELLLPAASHIERWLRLEDNIAYGRESFLMGQNQMHGWWQYFPIVFLLKTPVPTLLLATLTLGALAFGQRRTLTNELALGVFPLVYGAASLTSTLNIGYRHLLPVLPFLFVSAGRVIGHRRPAAGVPSFVAQGRRQAATRFALAAALTVWLCVGTTLIQPHYLAYFNPIAGGADQGYRFLADSNTDWGQTLNALAEYQQRHASGPVKLSQFTFLNPATYGVAYEPAAPMQGAPPVLPSRFDPKPGLYAISATTLDGVPLPLPSMYDWFRHRAPLAKVGHVMFLYDVAAKNDDPGWVAQCIVPVAPLTPDAITEGFGADGLRRVYFDCQQSWLYPDGGLSPGWFARTTPGIDGLRWPRGGERLEWWPDWTGRLPLTALRLSYVQPTPGELPPFAIWEWTGASIVPPEVLTAGEVVFDGTLAFMGYQAPKAARQGTAVDVMTYWRVLARPSRPLSLMLHLFGADDTPIAVGDGLGVPFDQLFPGDVIVQRHSLVIPANAKADTYQVRSGAYWLDNMMRLTADGGDSIILTLIQIKQN